MRFLCFSSPTAFSQGTKCFFWVFFPREHRLWQMTEAKVLEGNSRAQTTAGTKVPCSWDGSKSLPGDFQMEVMCFATKFFISSCNLERKSGVGCSPSDTPSEQSSVLNLHPVPPNPRVPADSHVLADSQKPSWIPSHSFLQHTRGVLLKCNSCLANTFHLINTFHLVID